MWQRVKDFWAKYFKFYQFLQLCGLTLVWWVLTHHGVTIHILDWWIAMFGIMLYGIFSMWEGRVDQKASNENSEV